MERHRSLLLSAVALLPLACGLGGCLASTSRPSSRPLAAGSSPHAIVVLADDPTDDALLSPVCSTRIVDARAETLAEVPHGAHTILELPPGDHLLVAFPGEGAIPSSAGCIGVLRASVRAGHTYVARVVRSGPGWRPSECALLDLVAVHAPDTAGVLARLEPRYRRELLPAHDRSARPSDDLDVREAVVGLAKLRAAGDDPTRALPPDLRLLGAPPAPWHSTRSTLLPTDGLPR